MDTYDEDEAYLMDEPEDTGRRRRRLEPHRGSSVLVMGILGLVVCVICGIFAWVWGNEDLPKMRAGRMDDAGRGMTEAGRILGIISVVLAGIGLLIFLLVAVVGGASSSYSF